MTPYNSILYHLDLSIMAYHLYAQTLIWPWDPFYEEMRKNKIRDEFKNLVRQSLDKKPRNNSSCPPNLDPILTDYNRIDPTKNSIFRPGNNYRWEVFQPIPEIVDSLIDGIMVKDGAKGEAKKYVRGSNAIRQPTDNIYFFEGETGKTKEYPSQKSMLGYVLERQVDPVDNTKYHVHIVFRGSRSGDAISAGIEGFKKKGNPDWVTDLQLDMITDNFSGIGKVQQSFSFTVKSALPNILFCLKCIHKNRNNNPPQKIFVTGHSLGGALAILNASYLNNLSTQELRHALDLSWAFPMKDISVLTYGCPPPGDEVFAKRFNTKIDCKRVKVNFDPITTDIKGTHVGVLIEATANAYGPLASSNHQYDIIRDKIIQEFIGLQTIPKTKPVEVRGNLNDIELIHLNNKVCKVVDSKKELTQLMIDYILILEIIMQVKTKKLTSLDSIVKLLEDFNSTDYTANFFKKLKESCDSLKLEKSWRIIIYLSCFLTQINYGEDVSVNHLRFPDF